MTVNRGGEALCYSLHSGLVRIGSAQPIGHARLFAVIYCWFLYAVRVVRAAKISNTTTLALSTIRNSGDTHSTASSE